MCEICGLWIDLEFGDHPCALRPESCRDDCSSHGHGCASHCPSKHTECCAEASYSFPTFLFGFNPAFPRPPGLPLFDSLNVRVVMPEILHF